MHSANSIPVKYRIISNYLQLYIILQPYFSSHMLEITRQYGGGHVSLSDNKSPFYGVIFKS